MHSRNLVLYAGILIVGIAIGYGFGHTASRAPLPAVSNASAATSTTKSFDLVVKGGAIVSGNGDIQVAQGDTVKLTVTNDADNELHLHGYNIMTDLSAGKPATITFVASASGRFPFELEKTKQELGAISVMPR